MISQELVVLAPEVALAAKEDLAPLLLPVADRGVDVARRWTGEGQQSINTGWRVVARNPGSGGIGLSGVPMFSP